jgi:hypothetical protein
MKYKPGVPSGEKLLFFRENRYTDNLEIVSFSLKDGAVSTLYSSSALVKGNVSGVIQQYEKEESTMLIFREFNERDMEIISGKLDSEQFSSSVLTFQYKEYDPF